MSTLTAVLYGALVVYLGGWFLGYWTGNFALLLFMLTLFTFAYWLAERFRFKPAREAAAAALESQDSARRAGLAKMGIDKVDGDVEQAKRKLLAQPWWLDWTAGLFPVILIVFLLRSFLFEPFKIPSGSMVPTLLVGDLILVNKFHYGVRLPVLNKKIIANNDPQRGDVMVFRYPVDPRVDYIKRVVGMPGRRGGLPEPEAVDQRPAGADQGAGRVLRRGQHALRADVQRVAGGGRTPHPGRSEAAGLLRRRPKDAFPCMKTADISPRAWSARCRRVTIS